RNPLKAVFASTSYSYAVTENNLLYSNFVGEGGAILFEAFEMDNTSFSHNLRLEGSKFYNKIKTTLKLSGAYTLMQREQFLNTNLAEVNNRNLSFRLALDSEVTDWLSTSYNSNFSFLQTSVAGRDFDEIRNQQHLLDLSF